MGAYHSRKTGIADVAQVVFVRKRLIEIQYFRTVISDEQREEVRPPRDTLNKRSC